MGKHSFRQKLKDMGLTSPQVDAVCQLVQTDIIGEYELEGSHNVNSPREIAELVERMEFVAIRNGLKREQRRYLEQE